MRNNKHLVFCGMYILSFKYTYSINEEKVLYNYLHRKHTKMNVFKIIPFNFITTEFFFCIIDDWTIPAAQFLRPEFNIRIPNN
jgi:hypothetical protein